MKQNTMLGSNKLFAVRVKAGKWASAGPAVDAPINSLSEKKGSPA